MSEIMMTRLIWVAGGIQAGIVAANFPLPKKLRVRAGLLHVPIFLRQVFYVHWLYIVIIVGLFSTLCFRFAHELSGASRLGRFLGAFMAAFWLLRVGLQWFYYDPEIRRQHRILDVIYTSSLLALVVVLGCAALRPLN